MTSSNGIMFCVTGHLCGEFTGGHLCILRTKALMFSFICVWINGWVNNREAGDLRRHRTRYDVIVMVLQAILTYHRADSRFAPSQWETALLCNDVSHWLGANLESVLYHDDVKTCLLCLHYWHFVKGFNCIPITNVQHCAALVCSSLLAWTLLFSKQPSHWRCIDVHMTSLKCTMIERHQAYDQTPSMTISLEIFFCFVLLLHYTRVNRFLVLCRATQFVIRAHMP